MVSSFLSVEASTLRLTASAKYASTAWATVTLGLGLDRISWEGAAGVSVEVVGRAGGAVVDCKADAAAATAGPNGGRPLARASSSCWRAPSASAHWRVLALWRK